MGKYLMRAPTGEIIFGGETMRFWSMQGSWLVPLRGSTGLEMSRITLDSQSWQHRRAGEFMTHAPLGSLNSVGGVATEVNAVNFVSPRSWLTCSHWFFGFGALLGHWWEVHFCLRIPFDSIASRIKNGFRGGDVVRGDPFGFHRRPFAALSRSKTSFIFSHVGFHCTLIDG